MTYKNCIKLKFLGSTPDIMFSIWHFYCLIINVWNCTVNDWNIIILCIKLGLNSQSFINLSSVLITVDRSVSRGWGGVVGDIAHSFFIKGGKRGGREVEPPPFRTFLHPYKKKINPPPKKKPPPPKKKIYWTPSKQYLDWKQKQKLAPTQKKC